MKIKFRVWYPETPERGKSMDYTDLVFHDGEFYEDWRGFENGWTLSKYRTDAIVMQYTGLLDKNRKEIYENDLCRYKGIRTKGEVELIGVVKYEAPEFYIGGNSARELNSKDCEVIGNIHESIIGPSWSKG